MKLSLLQTMPGILLCLLTIPIEGSSNNLHHLQLPVNNGTETLWAIYRPSNSPSNLRWAWIEGVIVNNRTSHNRTVPISGQAIGGVLIQAVYSMFFGDAEANLPYFEYILVYPPGRSRFPFNVTIKVESRNRPKPYDLTRRRFATALSNLGQVYDAQWDLGQLYEWSFEIGVIESRVFPTNLTLEVIANGTITHFPAAIDTI